MAKILTDIEKYFNVTLEDVCFRVPQTKIQTHKLPIFGKSYSFCINIASTEIKIIK